MKFAAPRFTTAVAAVAAVVATATLATASPAAAAVPTTTTDPATAAAGWLAQQFVDASHKPAPDGDHLDGSFVSGGQTFYFFDGGRTADALFALAASKTGKDKVSAVISYFAQHVDEYADLSKSQGGPYDGGVAKAAFAAIVAGADATKFGGFNLLQTLKDDECTAASTAPDTSCAAAGAARNIFSSVSESFALLAEARAGGAFAPSTAAVNYFLSLQCSDGGFTVDTAGGASCTSDVDATSYATSALVALGGHQNELAKAVDYLKSKRSAGGYWVAQGAPNVDTTGLAASALAAAGQDVSSSRAWLASQQVTTGPTVGAGATRGALKYLGAFDAFSSIKATADGLLGLAPNASLATLSINGATPGTALFAPTSTAKDVSVALGGTQTVTAVGFAAGETVDGVLHSTPVPLAPVKASKTGTATVTFTVPDTLAAGVHEVVLTGAASGLTTTVRFTVVAAATAPTHAGRTGASTSGTGQQLAASGLDRGQLVQQGLLGLGLLLAGAGAVYAGRRRRA